MSWDIYGNDLRPGYCEVHPDQPEPWPCSTCQLEEQQQPDPERPDPYDRPVQVQGHSHSEPICCWPDCTTHLTRQQMAELQA